VEVKTNLKITPNFIIQVYKAGHKLVKGGITSLPSEAKKIMNISE
jgi:hypothetical protein